MILGIVMKYLLLPLILLVSFSVRAQTYSSVIKDSEISNFMNSYLGDSPVERIIDKNFWKYNVSKFSDTSITKSFTKEDIAFLKTQVKSIRRVQWKNAFPNTRSLDMQKAGPMLHIKEAVYSYSIPLFSKNRKKALIIESFFCGLVCGGGGWYILQLQDDGSWKKTIEFNSWAE